MELLVAQRLTYLVDGAELLVDLNLRLAAGERVGLVGPNGSGKSTLLRLLAGQTEPYAGRLQRAPGVRTLLLPQTTAAPPGDLTLWQFASRALTVVRELEERMRRAEREAASGQLAADAYARLQADFEQAGGFGAEARLRRELAAVGFGAGDDDRLVAHLSAGERRRLALATTLAADPDILLLDEPTNHLDLPARVRLARRLAGFRGALVVISHDRALLDECTNRTAFLEPPGSAQGPSRLVLEPGHYTTAKARREGLLRASHKRERERAKEAARLEAMAAELARFGKKATARRRAAERKSESLRALTQAGEGGVHSRQLPHAPPHLASPGGGQVRRTERTLLEAARLSSPPVLTNVTLSLQRGERVALLGPNGSGKSTLLALLSGVTPSADPGSELRFAPGLKLRHIGQEERGLEDGRPLWEQATERVGSVRAGALLAGAGLATRTWNNRPSELSGGERARVGLALALAEDVDVWFIDEPTNDLDLAAVEALEEQLLAKLEASGAALLLATHDRRLAQALTREVWSVEAGSVVRYADVTAYLRGEHDQDAGSEPENTGSAGSAPTLAAAPADGPAEPGTPPGTGADPERSLEPGGDRDQSSGRDQSRDPSRDQNDSAVELLEARRAELLRLRDEEPNLTERDLLRVRTSLLETEEALMSAYAATLPAPAPSYRLREGGVTLFAEPIPAVPSTGSGREHEALVVLAPHAPNNQGILAGTQVAAEAFAALLGAQGLPDPDRVLRSCAAAWLEVRLVDSVGHLRFVERTQACALPYVKAALADAGVRLAFTRLGAQAVQLHHAGALPGAGLRPAGDGWWSLGLGEFLRAEGWRR